MLSKNEKKVNPVPDHYTAVTPWIISRSTGAMIQFLAEVFEAREVPNSRIHNEQGIVIHAVVRIQDALVMLFDAREGWGASPSYLNFYVTDIEKAFNTAVALGARPVTAITPLWFGEKVCRILDPFGNLFWINERFEDVDFTDPAAVQQRASSPEAVAGIAYIQSSLDKAMVAQKRFFEEGLAFAAEG